MTIGATLAAAMHPVLAAVDDPSDTAMPGADWVAVGNDQLDAMRGGYETTSGLQISIGIERAVYINGNLVTSTSISIPDLSHLAADQAGALHAAAGTLNLVQNGPGNSFDPGAISTAAGATPSAIATVVQNSLDNQTIGNLTVVNATANSLGLLKSMNFQSSLMDALGVAAGGK